MDDFNKLNEHPLDKYINFEALNHVYTIEGCTGSPISVTTLIHRYFEPFDSDNVICKMKSSENWGISKYNGMSSGEIKALWEKIRRESAELGTELHSIIELYIIGSNKFVPELVENKPEFEYFLHFWGWLKTEHPEWSPHRTEWKIFDREKNIAGCIDFTMCNAAGELWILDWKRSKEIHMTNKYGRKRGILPLSHLIDCNYTHYSLQLNLYRHIIERNYGKKVVRMDIVVFHPSASDYQIYNIPRMEEEINTIYDIRGTN